MAAVQITQQSQALHQGAPPPARASELAIRMAYVEMLSHVSNRFNQQRRIGSNSKWIRVPAGSPQPVMIDHITDHLEGRATYAATLVDDQGMTRLIVVDDDHGGLAGAQATVDHLRRLGVVSWAIARQSLYLDGSPKHDGYRLFILITEPAHVDDIKRAMPELLAGSGCSTDEIMHRTELPLGRSHWTPPGDEYGTLVLAGQQPQRIQSGHHGMAMLMQASALHRNQTSQILAYAPPAPPPARPVIPQAQTFKNVTISGTHADVVRAFNATYSARDVLAWIGLRRIGPVNYRCGCSSHQHGDKTPSVGIDPAGTLVYFNAPGCQYHNQGRPYTAFSLWQQLEHGGNYHQTISAARVLLSLPFVATPINQPERILKPAAIEPKDSTSAWALIESIGQRVNAKADKLTPFTLTVLRVICQQARTSGYCSLAWREIAELAACTVSTARRAVDTLVELGYIRKHANATQRGQHAPNVLELVNQQSMSTTHVITNEQSISIKEKEDHGFSFAADDPVPDHNSSFFNSPASDELLLGENDATGDWHSLITYREPVLTPAVELDLVAVADLVEDTGPSRWELARLQRLAAGENLPPAPTLKASDIPPPPNAPALPEPATPTRRIDESVPRGFDLASAQQAWDAGKIRQWAERYGLDQEYVLDVMQAALVGGSGMVL